MYGKIFASLYQGSLRGKADEILVFTNLIAYADREGWVDKHPRSIADDVGIPMERVKAAIATLEGPDQESRSPTANGARIERIDSHRDWGWRIVNHDYYRQLGCEEDRRERNRRSQQARRERIKGEQVDCECHLPSSPVIDGHEASASTYAYASDSVPVLGKGAGKGGRAKFVPPTDEEAIEYGVNIRLSKEDTNEFLDWYRGNGWLQGKAKAPIKDWQAAMRRWKSQADKAPKAGMDRGAFWQAREQMKMVEAELKAIKGRSSITALETIIQPQDVKRHAALVAQLKQLKQQLGMI